MAMNSEESQGTSKLIPLYPTYERQKCFIAYTEQAPWSDDLLSACQEVLSRPEFNLEPDYARKHFDPDVPLRQKALELIANARYGIYDLSYWQDEKGEWQMPRNVFTELGMAIALNRPTLLLRHASNRELELPECLKSASGHILEFSGETTLKRVLEKRLPQWVNASPERDWWNRYCIFGGWVCEYREVHPRAWQWGKKTLNCHISDGPDVDRDDFRGVIAAVLGRFSDVEYAYLDALPLGRGYDFLLCTYCQTVRSTPFAIYRITPQTRAEAFVVIGMSIAIETQFEYSIPKILVAEDAYCVPSLLAGYEVVEPHSDKERKAFLRGCVPLVMQKVRGSIWRPRPLPFTESALTPGEREKVIDKIHRAKRINVVSQVRVVGIGDGGCSAIARMMSEGISDVDFIAINTDVQALLQSYAPSRICIGEETTHGVGTGGDPEKGRDAALDAVSDLQKAFEGSKLALIIVGLGGGTGTGAAPVVAKLAKEVRAYTIGVVTQPLRSEGSKRAHIASEGIATLDEHVDALIVLESERLVGQTDGAVSRGDLFVRIDDALSKVVQAFTDILAVPGLINLDYDDVRLVLSFGDPLFVSFGRGSGKDRVLEAVRQVFDCAVSGVSLRNARGLLLSIKGGPDLSLFEVNQAASMLKGTAHPDVNLIFGAVVDESIGDEVRISVLASGLEDPPIRRPPTDGTIGGSSRGVASGEADKPEIPPFLNRRDSAYPANTDSLKTFWGGEDSQELPPFLARRDQNHNS